MSVTISVSQVRDALFQADRAENRSEAGVQTTPLFGKMFHEGLALLVDDQSENCPLHILADLDADIDLWKAALVSQMYQRFVGPRLTELQAVLNDFTPQILDFWAAMKNACHWFAELTWSLQASNASRRTKIGTPWKTLTDAITTEVPLKCELREPEWSESVCLVGIADAVVRISQTGAWCAIEFKTGRTSPVADLGQACLYHLLISATEKYSQTSNGNETREADRGALALVSFRPERHERLFSGAEIETAKQRLVDLIGRLAGVSSNAERKIRDEMPQLDVAINGLNRHQLATNATDEHHQLGQLIVNTLAEYNVAVTLEQPIFVGPTFVRYKLALGRGTRVQAVETRKAELQVRLGLRAEPFISRDDGQLVVDVQRLDRQKVLFDSIRDQIPQSTDRLGGSHVPVGVNLFGELVCADLSKPEHAHLLVAGTTGSGKSEWLRMAIAGLIVSNTPETLRLVVIDPKRNAFHALRLSPYLWQPIVFPDERSAPDVFQLLVDEMDRRYRCLDGANSIADLIQTTGQPFPRIVCICDEYRDLIIRDRQERKLIEGHICRLGAKARAAGIHLILATQEPSRDTIKGQLDSNIPARIGLKMGKRLESNMLLNMAGAENLLGHGDLLFKDIGQPRRLQAPLVTEINLQEIFERNIQGFPVASEPDYSIASH